MDVRLAMRFDVELVDLRMPLAAVVLIVLGEKRRVDSRQRGSGQQQANCFLGGATVPICTRAEQCLAGPYSLVLVKLGHVGREDEAVKWYSGDNCNAR